MGKSDIVSRRVPIELIFSGQRSTNGGHNSPWDSGDFELAPLVNLVPYNNVIESIQSGRSIAQSVHAFESSSQGEDTQYASMCEKNVRAKMGTFGHWFRRNSPLVYKIDDDRLLVSDGLIDACIDRYRRKNWIKVLMPQDVADQWDARPTQQLDDVCRRQRRDQIYTPVMHPAYQKFKYSRSGRGRLDLIRKFLGHPVNGMTLLDIGCNCGYYLFHFRRQGMNVTGIDIDNEHLDIAAAQSSMYGLDVNLKNISLKDYSPDQHFDVVLSLSVFWHILGWGNMPAVLSEEELTSIIDRVTGKYLFWESGPEPDREVSLIRNGTKLKKFRELGRTSATGIDQRVFGVFERTGS